MTRAAWIPAGIAIWAAHFAIVYGYTGLACARGLERSVPWVVCAVTLVAAGAAFVVAVRAAAARAQFAAWMTAAVAAIALYAILLEGLPALWVTPCALR